MVSKSTESWWSSYKDAVTTEVEIAKAKYTAFYQKEPSTSLVLSFFDQIFSQVLARTEEVALDKIKNFTRPSHIPAAVPLGFRINTQAIRSTVEHFATEVLTNHRKEESKATKESAAALEKNLLAAKKVALEFFNEKLPNFDFSYSMSQTELDEWIAFTTINGINFSYESLGLKMADQVTFSQQDLQAFGMSQKKVSANPACINCVAFALLRIQELRATKEIFEKQTDDSFLTHLFVHLNDWGYQTTSDPKPQDLAVYVDDANEPSHVGVVEKGHLIHSKLGLISPFSYRHKLFDVPAFACGRKVVFFRKPAKAI